MLASMSLLSKFLCCTFVSTLICLFVIPSSCAFAALREVSSPPNVVLILVDNVGYGDLGCYGNREVITPNMDRLAREGVLATDLLAEAACTFLRIIPPRSSARLRGSRGRRETCPSRGRSGGSICPRPS